MDATQPDDDDAPPARFQVDFTGQTLLGAYRVERRLAEGGMGSVYLAEDTNLGMRVVVKVPHARFLGEPGFRAPLPPRDRGARPPRAPARRADPRARRGGRRSRTSSSSTWAAARSRTGSSGAPQRLAERARAGSRPIAATLDFVHARGVVHRDVKPGEHPVRRGRATSSSPTSAW